MGTLGGIGELAQEAFGDGSRQGRAAARGQGRAERAGEQANDRLDIDPGWLWAIGGVLLLIAEIIAPGFFLVFLGAAAIATGLFTLLFDLGLAPQLALFAIYAALAVMIGKRWYAEPTRRRPATRAQRPGRAAGRQDA